MKVPDGYEEGIDITMEAVRAFRMLKLPMKYAIVRRGEKAEA